MPAILRRIGRIVEKIHSKLENAGFEVWRDQKRLETDWSREIAFALADCDVICLMWSQHAELQFCYENERRKNPALSGGKIIVRFIITPPGKVRDAWMVSSTLNNAEVEPCILARLKRWGDFNPIDSQSANMIAERIFLFGH